MWVVDKPPQWAGLSDSLLNASASLFHTAWQRCRGHIEPRKKVCFWRTFFLQHHFVKTENNEQTSKNIKGFIVITSNRVSGVAVNNRVDKWGFAGSGHQKGNSHQLKRKDLKVHYVCGQPCLLEIMFISTHLQPVMCFVRNVMPPIFFFLSM